MVATKGGEVEQKRAIRIPRTLWLVIVVVVVAVLVLAQNSTVLFPSIVSYRLVNERTVVLKVGVAPCSWTRVTNVTETPTQVRIKVETLPCPIPGPGTAELAVRELTLSLADDLGSRTVMDANGQPILMREDGTDWIGQVGSTRSRTNT